MALKNPAGVVAANARWAWGSVGALRATAERSIGRDRSGPIAIPRSDKRFTDPAFRDNPVYFLLAQEYLLFSQLVSELLDLADLGAGQESKAQFAAKFLVDAISPTNILPGNPAAVKRAFETGGKSVVSGLRNMAHDVRHNGGWPSQVDASGFEVGVNMGATKGSVIYRTDLIELIQYTPQTETVHSVPLLFCPPWINKYYIMDLAPGKSLIEWAVQHGHTCFAISYRNPDKSMRDVGFRDYLFKGPLDAVRVVREVTGASEVNTVSVCLGGTLTAIGLAYNAARGDDSIKSATFLNTHTDFTDPGILGTFTDESSVASLEKQMRKKGYLESSTMARTFSALRPNDLIFSYVVNNWLLGNKPPAFDLLAWNDDATRMPARMHSEYLQSCYLRNEFARGVFEVEGVRAGPRPRRRRRVRVGGRGRPRRAVDLGVQDVAAARREEPVRAVHFGPHRRHRQPAQPEGEALGERQPARRPARVEGGCAAGGRHLVERLDHVDRRPGRRNGGAARATR